jgi:hypothetical protein
MAEGQGDRVEELFHQAADLPPDEQQAFLDATCRNDPGLPAAVERLLADEARLARDDDVHVITGVGRMKKAGSAPACCPVRRLGADRQLIV